MTSVNRFGGTTGLAYNNYEQNTRKSQEEALRPSDQSFKIAFGLIQYINEKNAVIIRLQNNNNYFGGDENYGIAIPVLQPMDMIIHNFGPLTKNMPVKITYTGTLTSPRTAFCEVVGPVNYSIQDFVEQTDIDETGSVGFSKIFSPGII